MSTNDVSEDEREAEEQFEKAYRRGDHEAMKSIAGSTGFKQAILRVARRRAEALVREVEGGSAAAHLAQLAVSICVEAEMRGAITKIQKARASTLTSRLDRQAQQLSALEKRLAAIERKATSS